MHFEFATAARIVFGPGTAGQVPGILRDLGSRALVVTGRPRGAAASLVAGVEAAGLAGARVSVVAEPSIDDVRAAWSVAAEEACDVVLSVGGGSVIDAGKAVAALLGNGGDPLDYLEVVGRGQALASPSVPFVAVPTTAGSGAEVTRNAVLTSPAHGVKASLRSPFMLPRAAVVDPELTADLPPSITATTGLDALAQLVEPFLSRRANPLADACCREGIPLVASALRRAFRDGGDAAARQAMSLAALLGGLALANAGLGAVHGFAGPIGGRTRAPHGAICAALLPAVLRVNLEALRREAATVSLDRLDEVARLLTGRPGATAGDGIAWIEALREDLGIPRLSALGLAHADLPALAAQARAASSMRGNPIDLTRAELARVLAESW